MKVAKSIRLDSLDGLRGFAALYVVLHHMSTNRLISQFNLLTHGWMLVDTFFVISGFVMAYTYGESIHNLGQCIVFIRRRLARIWPLHGAIILAMMIPRIASMMTHGIASSQLFQANSDHSLTSWFASLALLHGMGIYDHAVWNGPSWTLSVEFFAYLVFSAASRLSARLKRVFFLTVVLCTGGYLGLRGIYIAAPIQLSFIRCLFGFFCGVLACGRFKSFAPTVAGRQELTAFLEILSLMVLVAMVWVGNGPLALAFPVVCAFFIVLLASGSGIASRLLGSYVFRLLGDWSLGIYLLHIPILNLLWSSQTSAADIDLHFATSWTWRESGVFFFLVFCLAAASNRLIEKPARDWLGGRRLKDQVMLEGSISGQVPGGRLT